MNLDERVTQNYASVSRTCDVVKGEVNQLKVDVKTVKLQLIQAIIRSERLVMEANSFLSRKK